MRNKLQFLKTVMFSVFLLTLGCRQEADWSHNAQEKTRADEFFKNAEQNGKLGNSSLISNSIIKLKKFNDTSNFLSKISDQNGLPVWSQIMDTDVNAYNGGLNKGSETTEVLVIPLRQEDNFLSSVMYVENPDSENPTIYTVTNQELKAFANSEEIDKTIRENILNTFLYFDYEIFGKRKYSSIPPTLFDAIPLQVGKDYKSFSIDNVTTTTSSNRMLMVCIESHHCVGCPSNEPCDGCNLCVTTNCTSIGTTGGGGIGSGPSGPGDGSPGTTGGGGSGDNSTIPWYVANPNIYNYNSNVRAIFVILYNQNITLQEEHLDYLQTNSGVTQMFKTYLSNNNLEKSENAIKLIDFLLENLDTIEPEKLLQRLESLDVALNQNPNLLLDIPCVQLSQWQDVASFQVPQSVKNKINSIPNQNSYWSSWAITDIESGAGANLNMDLFPVKITDLPNKPNGQKYTSAEFFNFFRKNLNLFAEQFIPIEDNHYDIHDTALWNSTNPLGALIHIKIPIDDGSVVCSGYSTNTWIFTTMKAPQSWSYDGLHPVAGNRKFSYYTDPNDNSVTIYTRGVDRTSKINDGNTPIINAMMQQMAFQGADQLWRGMQNKLSAYINSKGGTASKVQEEKYRPNYSAVKNYIKGKAPISSLGCK